MTLLILALGVAALALYGSRRDELGPETGVYIDPETQTKAFDLLLVPQLVGKLVIYRVTRDIGNGLLEIQNAGVPVPFYESRGGRQQLSNALAVVYANHAAGRSIWVSSRYAHPTNKKAVIASLPPNAAPAASDMVLLLSAGEPWPMEPLATASGPLDSALQRVDSMLRTLGGTSS